MSESTKKSIFLVGPAEGTNATEELLEDAIDAAAQTAQNMQDTATRAEQAVASATAGNGGFQDAILDYEEPEGMSKSDGKPGESLDETPTDELQETHDDLTEKPDPQTAGRRKAIAGELKQRGVQKSLDDIASEMVLGKGGSAIDEGIDYNEILEKAHYTKRTGGPGHYKYEYADDGKVKTGYDPASGKERPIHAGSKTVGANLGRVGFDAKRDADMSWLGEPPSAKESAAYEEKRAKVVDPKWEQDTLRGVPSYTGKKDVPVHVLEVPGGHYRISKLSKEPGVSEYDAGGLVTRDRFRAHYTPRGAQPPYDPAGYGFSVHDSLQEAKAAVEEHHARSTDESVLSGNAAKGTLAEERAAVSSFSPDALNLALGLQMDQNSHLDHETAKVTSGGYSADSWKAFMPVVASERKRPDLGGGVYEPEVYASAARALAFDAAERASGVREKDTVLGKFYSSTLGKSMGGLDGLTEYLAKGGTPVGGITPGGYKKVAEGQYVKQGEGSGGPHGGVSQGGHNEARFRAAYLAELEKEVPARVAEMAAENRARIKPFIEAVVYRSARVEEKYSAPPRKDPWVAAAYEKLGIEESGLRSFLTASEANVEKFSSTLASEMEGVVSEKIKAEAERIKSGMPQLADRMIAALKIGRANNSNTMKRAAKKVGATGTLSGLKAFLTAPSSTVEKSLEGEHMAGINGLTEYLAKGGTPVGGITPGGYKKVAEGQYVKEGQKKDGDTGPGANPTEPASSDLGQKYGHAAVGAALEKLRVKSGLMPTYQKVGDWEMGFGYSREDKSFTLTLTRGSLRRTVHVPRNFVETRSKSQWMADQTHRLTAEGMAFYRENMSQAMLTYEQKNRSAGAEKKPTMGGKTFQELHGGKGGLIEKLNEYDKKNPKAAIVDRTPSGYGPTEKSMLSGLDALEAFAKGDLPSGESKMDQGHGDASPNGGDLTSTPRPKAEGAASPSQDPGAPSVPEEKLSEDDDAIGSQLKGGEPGMKEQAVAMGKSLQSYSRQELDQTIAREKAAWEANLRKGQADVVVGVGIAAPQTQPEALERAQYSTQGEDARVLYSNASDLACERLFKSDNFYQGGEPSLGFCQPAFTRMQPCGSCGGQMSKSLSACPHCGVGATVPEFALSKSEASVPVQNRRGPGLRPARGQADLVLPNGVKIGQE